MIESKSLDRSREEVLESVGAKMAMLHDHEKPNLGVFGSFDDTPPGCCLSVISDGITLASFKSQGSLFRGQPPCCQRLVGQDEERRDGNNESDGALKDEKPLPTSNAGLDSVKRENMAS